MDHLAKLIGSLQAEHARVMTSDPRDLQAEAQFERRVHSALSLHPENEHLLYTLGTLYSQTDRAGAGIALLKHAIDLGLDGPDAWNNLGAACKAEHKDASAAACYEKAIELCEEGKRQGNVPAELINSSLSAALHGMASLYVNAGKPEKIIEWADKALALDPNDRYALWNRGLGYLESGRWKEGWEAYDVAGFMSGDGFKPIERKLKTYGGLPRWNGEKGKTVICYGEQGIGDELMFASMIPDLMKDCRVIIDCDKRLEALFKRSFPEALAVYPTSNRDAAFPWLADHQVDGYVPMGSLGRYYRPDAASFPRTPYIKADPGLVAKWRNVLGSTDKLRVGISWAGGLKKTRFDQRTIPLREWTDILSVPGIEWHSFQYHPQAAQECADVGRLLNVPIHHWGDVIADYDKTAAVLHSMDLVISVNTSLIHLCGSLGIRTWCLTPVMCAWRYGVEGENPFYGSVEMVRQQEAGKWSPVLKAVAGALREEAQKEAA